MASKNKRIGRKAEKKFVNWFADRFGLIPLIKKLGLINVGEAEVARAEDISQMLDNAGVDVWFSPHISLSSLQIQIKSTLCTDKKTKKIDVQPLLDIKREGIRVLITEMKVRPRKNMMHYADVVTMTLDDFGILLSAYQEQQTHEVSSREDQGV